MVRNIRVQLLDDLDGSPADETVRFALDGVQYEIDLSSAHAGELRDAVSVYAGAGRKAGRGVTASPARTHRGSVASGRRNDRAQNRAVRDWAKRKKIKLSDRGRIPRSVVERYEAEAGR